jgi:hypothetical protein
MIKRKKKKIILIIILILIFLVYICLNDFYDSNNYFDGIIIKNETINPHNYIYIINPKESICKNKNLTLLAFVLTRRDNFIQRETIRTTWSNKTLFSQMRVIFMIGSSNDTELDKKIENESKLNGDIVQESFLDTYLNLTLKTIQGIKWVSNYCSNAKYILKVDDDVFVNSFSLLNYLDNLKLETNNNLLCRLRKRSPIVRDLNSKFYISYNITKKKFYSKYCDGPAYIFQGNLAPSLYEASLHIKYFKFEDIYFGLLATNLNLNFIDLNARYRFEYSSFQINQLFESNTISSNFFMFPFYPEILRNTWSKLTFANFSIELQRFHSSQI